LAHHALCQRSRSLVACAAMTHDRQAIAAFSLLCFTLKRPEVSAPDFSLPEDDIGLSPRALIRKTQRDFTMKINGGSP
ncbi:MAG TPA: hypothetical protein VIW26_12780, partial [Gemmatimonadales bacterium]